MKKILLFVLCALMSLSLLGCSQKGSSVENLDSEKSVDQEATEKNSYKNNLDDLVKYLISMNYLPSKEEPTAMLAKSIGAVKGYKYEFKVDGKGTLVELYEYNLGELDSNAQRVRSEIIETGSFHLFKDKSVDDTTYAAAISDDGKGKYMVMYSGTEERAKKILELVTGFEKKYSSTEGSEVENSSKPEEASKVEEASKTEEASKAEEASKTSEASSAA